MCVSYINLFWCIVKFSEIEFKKWNKNKLYDRNVRNENKKIYYATVITRRNYILCSSCIIWGSVTLQVALIYLNFIISKWFEVFSISVEQTESANKNSTLKVHRFLLCHVTFSANDYGDDDDDEVYAMIIDMISYEHFALHADANKYLHTLPTNAQYSEFNFISHVYCLIHWHILNTVVGRAREYTLKFHLRVMNFQSIHFSDESNVHFIWHKIVLRNIWTPKSSDLIDQNRLDHLKNMNFDDGLWHIHLPTKFLIFFEIFLWQYPVRLLPNASFSTLIHR